MSRHISIPMLLRVMRAGDVT